MMKVLLTRNQTAQGSESNEKGNSKATKSVWGIIKQFGNPNKGSQCMIHNEAHNVFAEKLNKLHSVQMIQSEANNVFTEKVNKIALGANVSQ